MDVRSLQVLSEDLAAHCGLRLDAETWLKDSDRAVQGNPMNGNSYDVHSQLHSLLSGERTLSYSNR